MALCRASTSVETLCLHSARRPPRFRRRATPASPEVLLHRREIYHTTHKIYHTIHEFYHTIHEIYHTIRKKYHTIREIYHTIHEVYHMIHEIYPKMTWNSYGP